MLGDKRIGVVVPAYNEEKLIGRVIETMPDYVDRIYVIDDCSVDKTNERIRAYLNQPSVNGKVELITHKVNKGVGASIVTGYKRALEEDIDIVAVMAGDAQMDPEDLRGVLLPVIEGRAEYVKGNRLFTGEAWSMIPKYRYMGNAFLSLLTKIASGYWHLADSQTGFTAISADCLKLLPLDELYPRYGYPNQLLVILNVYDMRVMDVPVKPVYNVGERSGIKLRNVVPRLSWLLTKCFLWRLKEKYIIRDFHPLVFFYTLGLTLFPAGVLFGVYLLYHRIFIGRVVATSVLFAVFLFVSGLQSLFFAMWFDMEYNNDLKAK
jgi:glycosyltransferase involved in cell wall biosynthesis